MLTPTAPLTALGEVVAAALAEDAPWGDVTTEALLPADARATAVLRARVDGVLAGVDAVRLAAEQAATATGGTARVEVLLADGARFCAGDVLARIDGTARAVLRAERVALNLVQRLSGIATLTARYVAAVEGSGTRIADTRKTTPGLRVLEKHAVRCGGGSNHRWSLSDAVMVKDNHLAVLTASGIDVTSGLRALRQRIGHTTTVVVEVDRLDQLDAVLAADVDVVLLDNFSLADLRTGVQRVAGRATVEASGGITLDTVAAVAATGVDVVSVGALTQAAAALDLGLDVEVRPDDRTGTGA
ncbi:nicotinate-nucleotide pyrophosphorylase (carboxylating) [Kineococcus xinjiangensis]|uniref:Nicotinate-nucleotide pyrophosphorylase [carboxylating] n=1 Tax=Kineococcus xinjiangensis TaxID=512762 RepID=A0A2S6IT38_9ACTN|nr:carboxylating nicotinate-nucleotide diphosphorylase [Kineococcus xinjiangensis]PPK97331.1 nicotinate-nucleotide pyrophosphorylase (carboxylating) [Kineococcus xinjiangensis]